MFKTLSTFLVIFCLVWLGYVFFKKSLALTNTNIFELMSWAWSNHPKGKMLNFFFVLMFFTSFVLMISTLQKGLNLAAGQPQIYVYAGDELLNRYQRYYRADDAQRTIVQLPKEAGSRLRFSYPTHLDTLFTRQIFLSNGDDPKLYSHITDSGLAASIATSLFFYFSFAMCIVILHTWARDLMVEEARTVTPMDSVGEFIVVLSVLLILNAVLLTAQHTLYKVKMKTVDTTALQQKERLAYQTGDQVQARLLDSSTLANVGKDSGLVGDQAAYYLVELQTPQGIAITASFQFGFSNKHRADVERFVQQLAKDKILTCEVTEHMTLRPVALRSSGVNWFED